MARPRRVYMDFSSPGRDESDGVDLGDVHLSLDDFPNPEFYPQRLLNSMNQLALDEPPRRGSPRQQQQQQQHELREPPKVVPPVTSTPPALSMGGHQREPIPSVPEERLIAQQTSVEFKTFEHACPPAADAQYAIVDQGIAGPDHLRLSMYNVPASAALREKTQLPLGALVRPFAHSAVPTADFTTVSGGPPRCARCRTYMNPSMSFIREGTLFRCNMCQHVNRTPDEYYQPCGPDQRRIDWQERPELYAGTYDLIVGTPGDTERAFGGSGRPLRHVFIIDSSRDSLNKGIPALAASAIRHTLYGPNNQSGGGYLPPGTTVAILTYAAAVSVYRLHGASVDMLVHSDIQNLCLPPDAFFDPETCFDGASLFLDNIASYFTENWEAQACFGAALQLALTAMDGAGGRVTAVAASLPNHGPGALTRRDSAVYGLNVGPSSGTHEPQKELFMVTSKFYEELAAKYRDQGVLCDLFVFNTGCVDMQNFGLVAEVSGGVTVSYPRYVEARDARAFIADMLRRCSDPAVATEAAFKLRTSTGLQTERCWGVHEKDGLIGALTSSSNFVVNVIYDNTLDPEVDVHFQSAVLYTDASGARRVRVSNIPAGVTAQYKSVLKFVDTDTVLAILTRQALSRLPTMSLREIRKGVADKCNEIFASARSYGGGGLPPGHLLMPTSLRQLLPLGNALMKSIALGRRVFTSDTRIQAARMMQHMSADELSLFLYPRIYDVESLESFEETLLQTSDPAPANSEMRAEWDYGNHLVLPTVAASWVSLCESSVFLLCNGQICYLYLKHGVPTQLLKDLFDVETLEEVPPYLDELPALTNSLSLRMRALCSHLARRVGRSWLPLQVARQEHDGAEYFVHSMLVEDSNEAKTYAEFVTDVHQHARKLSQETTKWH